jgi:hypothetical protein
MTRTCPDCGSTVEYATRTSQVLTGTCDRCSHVFTIVQDQPVGGLPPDLEGNDVAGEAGDGGPRGRPVSDAPLPSDAPRCEACGSSMTFHTSAGRGIEGICSGCDAAVSYLPAAATGREEPRFRLETSSRPSEPSGGFRSERARPCRQCGGPLRFSTNPDGTVSCECGACGNRFTLPPRRDSERSRGGGGGRRFDRGSRPTFGGGGRNRSYGRGQGGRFRPRPRRDDSEGDRPERRRSRRE